MPGSRLYWDDSQVSTVGGGTCNSGTTNNNSTGTGIVNDIVGQPSPGHAWNGDGNAGMLIPAPSVGGNDADNLQCNDFGNARLINTWAWGIELYVTQNLTLGCIDVSGTVWDDADNSAAGTFLTIQTNAEPGTNAGNQLYASLIDPVSGNVLNSVAVQADGSYLLAGCPINATDMSVVISTTAGIAGQPAPAPFVPAGWVATSPLVRLFNTVTSTITDLDFGIEQLPDSDPQNYTIANPALNDVLVLNGSGTPSDPGPLTGNDPEDGTMGGGKDVMITNVPTNAELYYAGILVSNNDIIPSYDPSLLSVKFTVASILSTSFDYAWIDAAGFADATPATYTINWGVSPAVSDPEFSCK